MIVLKKREIGKLLIAPVALLAASNVIAGEYNLAASGNTTLNVPGAVGGTAIFADNWQQPTGTGVFDPFLTIDSNGQTSTGGTYIEQGYNTSGFDRMYLDQLRPQWNNLLKVGDLAKIDKNGTLYYAFVLDANEPGNQNRMISIDNVRVYTSAADNTATVGNDTTKLGQLGTLRWAMNEPLSAGTTPPDLNGFNVENWVKLDSNQENIGHSNVNGGSGMSDMVVYIPVSAFGTAANSDYVWFYNLNGVHYSADRTLAADSGYEEWRAVVGPQTVPDGGSTLALLGSAFTLFGLFAHRFKAAKA